MEQPNVLHKEWKAELRIVGTLESIGKRLADLYAMEGVKVVKENEARKPAKKVKP